LKPLDLVLRLPKWFTATMALDTIAKPFVATQNGDENFATVLRRGLGRTMCESFYFPYVRKLWGLEPTELAVTLAARRVSASSVSKILKKVTRQLAGFRTQTSGGFYYPRRGYGQISQSLHDAATAAGANFILNADVAAITCQNGRVTGVRYRKNDKAQF